MYLPGQPPAPPATAGEALSAISAGLSYLNAADAASLTTAEQADCLRALEQAAAMHTAARARVLAAFHARGGCEDDGHGSTRTWLKWQTRITGGAAAGAIGWTRRLSAHPAVGDALAGAEISESWARQICEWTEKLPETHRHAADGSCSAPRRAAPGCGTWKGWPRRSASVSPAPTLTRTTGSMTGACGWPRPSAAPGSSMAT
jgi:hypothetical protein